jgi:pyruvate formate lyase activating enzyme
LYKARFWDKSDSNDINCGLCEHRCIIRNGDTGICGVRKNIEGELFTSAYGCIVAGNIDPIEKKPLYHFLPGTKTYSIATLGCNFRCSFCQNWSISQIAGRDPKAIGKKVSPGDIVESAYAYGCESISYTYTEPTIFYEYAYDTAKIAKESGLRNIFVTNGFMTREIIEHVTPVLDAVNIDLKFFKEDSYKRLCGGRLAPVLEAIKGFSEKGVWVEVTTLVIPGVNDSGEELTDIARFICGVNDQIPWHISRFHPDYQCVDKGHTPLEVLEKAVSIGEEAGLKHIYMGNI